MEKNIRHNLKILESWLDDRLEQVHSYSVKIFLVTLPVIEHIAVQVGGEAFPSTNLHGDNHTRHKFGGTAAAIADFLLLEVRNSKIKTFLF